MNLGAINVDSLMNLGSDRLFLFFATFLLCLARIIGFFVQAPIWGSNHINKPILIGFSLLVTIVVWPNILIPKDLPGGAITMVLLLLINISIGLVIGFVSFIPMGMAQFGGEMMDIQMGLSSAAANDPSSKGTINLIRRLKFYLAMIFYMMMDGHHVLLKSVAKSFDIVPLTGVQFSAMLINELIRMTNELLYVGVQIAMPVIGALFIVQIALGIMAKVAPQMNVFMLSFPLNILAGMSLLTAAIPFYTRLLRIVFERNFDDIITALQYMIPK
jgi:flagellar biosynthesis protein FliR